MKRSDFEIMAPVGSRESLAAALAAGTDAIYFGIGGLNMRSRSSANFTADDMEEIAAACAARGVKTYLTVNTVRLRWSQLDRRKSESFLMRKKFQGNLLPDLWLFP